MLIFQRHNKEGAPTMSSYNKQTLKSQISSFSETLKSAQKEKLRISVNKNPIKIVFICEMLNTKYTTIKRKPNKAKQIIKCNLGTSTS